jgi:hypothetical protein
LKLFEAACSLINGETIMGFRSYIPGLILALRQIYRYATRYSEQLSGVLTTQQQLCLTAVINAVAECLAAIAEPTPEP